MLTITDLITLAVVFIPIDMTCILVVYTCLWRYQAGNWWWHKPKEPFSITFDSNGGNLAWRGNPVEAMKAFFDRYFPEDKTPAEEVLSTTIKGEPNGNTNKPKTS